MTDPTPEHDPEHTPNPWAIPAWLPGAPVTIEPTADQRAFAKHMRGVFLAFTAEGFTEPQALALLQTMMGGHR